jgi:hypothetical protein
MMTAMNARGVPDNLPDHRNITDVQTPVSSASAAPMTAVQPALLQIVGGDKLIIPFC